ncbi:MAG: phosphatase PAP2 family protein [Candidatus Omnitrophica bacterium]|nr:phosphatase PAP2 family protein [Candidatus Omnitrophota bacterium]
MPNAWETQLLLAMHRQWQHPFLHAWMARVTWLGDPRLVGLALLLGLWWGRRRRDVVAAGLGALAALPLVEVLKEIVHRPRPVEVVPHLAPATGWSFPSGHAAAAFALAAFLSVGWPRWRGAWWTLAALVAWSRVALGVHYPSDCLAGAVIGVGMVFGAVGLCRTRDGTR